MKLVNNIIEKFGIDKVLHFFGGAWIVSMFSPIGWGGVIIGIVAMLALSFVKEIFLDGTFDIKDIFAACLGGAVSVVVAAISFLTLNIFTV